MKINEIIHFLKDATDYAEKRIELVDNKASVLIAGMSLLLAAISFTAALALSSTQPCAVRALGHSVQVVGFACTLVSLCYLLWAVRPSKTFLSKNAEMNHILGVFALTWPHNGWPPEDSASYQKLIGKLDKKAIKREYEQRHYITLQLLKRKYAHYRLGAMWAKLTVVCYAIFGGMFILVRAAYALLEAWEWRAAW